MLKLTSISTGYIIKQVIYDLSMNVNEGEIVAVIGPNGSGKSTILKAICGLLPIWDGNIMFNGTSIKNNSTPKNISLGLTYCPQGGRIFDELNVLENLQLGGFNLPKEKLDERIEYVINFFPILKERLKQFAGKLSGGEQQMLALARALIPSPRLLLLDEPSLGLAPNSVKDLFEKIREINITTGLAILIVEQNVNAVLEISNRIYGVKLGKVFLEAPPTFLIENKNKLKELYI